MNYYLYKSHVTGDLLTLSGKYHQGFKPYFLTNCYRKIYVGKYPRHQFSSSPTFTYDEMWNQYKRFYHFLVSKLVDTNYYRKKSKRQLLPPCFTYLEMESKSGARSINSQSITYSHSTDSNQTQHIPLSEDILLAMKDTSQFLNNPHFHSLLMVHPQYIDKFKRLHSEGRIEALWKKSDDTSSHTSCKICELTELEDIKRTLFYSSAYLKKSRVTELNIDDFTQIYPAAKQERSVWRFPESESAREKPVYSAF